jgi:hypothetical protein
MDVNDQLHAPVDLLGQKNSQALIVLMAFQSQSECCGKEKRSSADGKRTPVNKPVVSHSIEMFRLILW